METISPAAFEAALKRHVLEAWFPRCLDRTHGGFLCDFDRRWNATGPDDKLLEFQARQTLLAAEASGSYPQDTRLREAALHGFRYLRDVLWDRDAGGWFHRLDREGRPLEQQTKHTHGMAYAIEACAEVHRCLQEPGALELAREGFAWVDRFARDREHGGYWGQLTRAGRVITDPAESPWPGRVDSIGTEYGLKDLNVHSDLLETFALLYRVWPDGVLGDRLSEAQEILSARMAVPATGALHMFVTGDWRPIPHLVRAGYQCQTAFRLRLAGQIAGAPDAHRAIAGRLMDHAVRSSIDSREGGLLYAVVGAEPDLLSGRRVGSRAKPWWIQWEALKGLLAMSHWFPERPDYLAGHQAVWEYLGRNVIDGEADGTFSAGRDELPRWRRRLPGDLLPAWLTCKGDPWKDGSHEGRALLYCVANGVRG